MSSHREARIRERAYAIWEEEGRPPARDLHNWQRAEEELAAAEIAETEAGAAEVPPSVMPQSAAGGRRRPAKSAAKKGTAGK